MYLILFLILIIILTYLLYLFIYYKDRNNRCVAFVFDLVSLYRDAWSVFLHITIVIAIKFGQGLVKSLHMASGSDNNWSNYPKHESNMLTAWDVGINQQ